MIYKAVGFCKPQTVRRSCKNVFRCVKQNSHISCCKHLESNGTQVVGSNPELSVFVGVGSRREIAALPYCKV